MKTIDYTQFVAMLRSGVTRVKANQALLGELDSHGGDGDHGTTMARAMNLLEKAIHKTETSDFKTLLSAIGWHILGADGGSTGPLFGSLFLGMSETAPAVSALDSAQLAEMFESGLERVRKRTKAEVGDKTLMDALVPAVAAFREAADAKAPVSKAFSALAKAARTGAESTKTMQAKFGRAKSIGEESIGSQDPGATSTALLFEGFAEGVK